MSAFELNKITPETSGIVDTHAVAIHQVCKAQNIFLLIRPSTDATMRLIKAGFATKSMDVHDKSSNWGLTSGFVPCDTAFDKNAKGDPNPDLHAHAHGHAQPVHLALTTTQLNALMPFRHFGDGGLTGGACATLGEAGDEHYHWGRRGDVCQIRAADGKVYWKFRDKPMKAGGHGARRDGARPMMVWGYHGVPVTGDYDLWMVVPPISKVHRSEDHLIYSIEDDHGRSAATQYIKKLLNKLNAACMRLSKPVFNHGAEAQNFSFTQALDERLVVFCPGSRAPFILHTNAFKLRDDVPGGRAFALSLLMHDMYRNGYVAVRNPKWETGKTLSGEDLAFVAPHLARQSQFVPGKGSHAEQYPVHGDVAKGREAYDKVKRVRGDLGPLTDATKEEVERADQLTAMRNGTRLIEDKGHNLLLDPNAFPDWMPALLASSKKLDRLVYGRARDANAEYAERTRGIAGGVEKDFGRTGFVESHGTPGPVDRSRGARSPWR